jgi:hypothetical protein
MTEAAEVIFSRPAGRWRDALRAYRLYIDGDPCGTIRAGQEIRVGVEPGTHVVQARIDWTASPAERFHAEPGASTLITVEPAGTALRFWQAFTRTGYLRLKVYSQSA